MQGFVYGCWIELDGYWILVSGCLLLDTRDSVLVTGWVGWIKQRAASIKHQ